VTTTINLTKILPDQINKIIIINNIIIKEETIHHGNKKTLKKNKNSEMQPKRSMIELTSLRMKNKR